MGGCQGKIRPTRSNLSSPSSHGSQTTIVEDGHQPAQHHDTKTDVVPYEESPGPDATLPAAFGKTLREEYFSFDPDYHNLNHSSYGTIPKPIQSKLYHYQSLYERRPDHFIRYTYPSLLLSNRAAVASLLRAPSLDTVVFVPNATTGVNTILRGLASSWSRDGLDEILYFGTIYGACDKTIAYVQDSTHGLVRGRRIELAYPVADAAIVRAFRDTVQQARRVHGKRPRVALFDTVSSTPGVRFPFEQLVAACRELGVLSLVDAAQGVGMLDLDLGRLDPDFLTTNCHKWLFVPRACAVLYVPLRNQRLVRSTLPTSHSYVPDRHEEGGLVRDASSMFPGTSDHDEENEMQGRSGEDGTVAMGSSDPSFADMFAYVGTSDSSPYLCVKDAIEWRERVLGGEDRIRAYCLQLARDGGDTVANILGTWVMQNEEGTLLRCSMVNVAIPVVVMAPEAAKTRGGDKAAAPAPSIVGGDETLIPYKDAQRVWEWMTKVLVEEYQTFIPLYYHAARFWARLSAQVYLDLDDFQWAGKTLKELSDRVARKEYDL